MRRFGRTDTSPLPTQYRLYRCVRESSVLLHQRCTATNTQCSHLSLMRARMDAHINSVYILSVKECAIICISVCPEFIRLFVHRCLIDVGDISYHYTLYPRLVNFETETGGIRGRDVTIFDDRSAGQLDHLFERHAG